MGRPWFPLALLGFGLLAMVVFSVGDSMWFSFGPYSATGDSQVFEVHQIATEAPAWVEPDDRASYLMTAERVAEPPWRPLVSWGPNVKYASSTWLVLNIGVFLGTVVFFAVRARRRGTPIRGRTLAALLLGGPVALLLADLTMYWELKLEGGFRGPLLTIAGLVLLAWLERSRLLLAVAVLFALLNLVVVGGVTGVLAATAVVFAGAFAVLLWTPRRRLSGNVENGPGEH